MSKWIDADILVQDTIQEYARSKQYRDAIIRMVNKASIIEPKTKVIAQVTFDEEKLREIVKEAVERFKEEYEIEPKRERCEYCKDGDFIGQRLMLGNDEKWHKIRFCPSCGTKLERNKE